MFDVHRALRWTATFYHILSLAPATSRFTSRLLHSLLVYSVYSVQKKRRKKEVYRMFFSCHNSQNSLTDGDEFQTHVVLDIIHPLEIIYRVRKGVWRWYVNTTPSYRRHLSLRKLYGICKESWSWSPADPEGQLYCFIAVLRLTHCCYPYLNLNLYLYSTWYLATICLPYSLPSLFFIKDTAPLD